MSISTPPWLRADAARLDEAILSLTAAAEGWASNPLGKSRKDRLGRGDSLAVGDYLQSAGGGYLLQVLANGDVAVLRVTDRATLWSGKVGSKGGVSLTLQTDGNLVLTSAAKKAVWSSNTAGKNADTLKMQDDGNLVLYAGTTALWSSNTSTTSPVKESRPLATVIAETSTALTEAVGERAARTVSLVGTALGAGSNLTLPEMAVSFARGLHLQLRALPTTLGKEEHLFELSCGEGKSSIALVHAGKGRVELRWHDSAGTQYKAAADGALVAGVWSQLSVTLAPAGVSFARNGEALVAGPVTPAVKGAVPLPAETSRSVNLIGESAAAAANPFTGAIADVRLFNRAVGVETLLDLSARQLTGIEPGLQGWWTLEGKDGAADRSPFGRHGALSGAFKAGTLATHTSPAADDRALDLTKGAVTVKAAPLTGAGLTWQGWLRPDTLADGQSLLRLDASGVQLSLRTSGAAGDVVASLKMGKSETTAKAAGALKVGTWTALALRQSVDGALRLFVHGQPAGEAVAAGLLPAGNADVEMGRGLDGQVAELRLWSRPLTGAEIADTTPRRIHGWAPGLLGAWRCDEIVARETLFNADATGSEAVLTGGTSVKRAGLDFDAPPAVAPPRVPSLSAGALTLPAIAALTGAGLTVQLWVAPDSNTGRGTLVELAGKNAQIRLTASSGAVTLAYRGADGKTRELLAAGLLSAGRWTQLSASIDSRGTAAIYADGVLAAREDLGLMASGELDKNRLGTDLSGAFTELRVWSRALTEDEIVGNWQRRIATAPQLAASHALLGALGAVTGTVLLREAPSLPLPATAPAPRATVVAKSSLLADPNGKGAPTQIVVELTASDDQGRPVPQAALTLLFDRAAKLSWGSGASARHQKVAAGQRLEISAGILGRLRLCIEAEALLAPVLQARHAGMGEGEWSLIAPDRAIHAALASVTAAELSGGRKPKPGSTFPQKPLVKTGAEGLASLLRGAMGTALSFNYEEASTAALAFGADEEAPAATPLQAVPAGRGGASYAVAEGVTLVRRVGFRPTAEASAEQEGPMSFGLAEDIAEGVSLVVSRAASLASTALETVESVARAGVGGLVQSVSLAVNTVINGVRITNNWVFETVSDIVDAIGSVFAAIGVAVGQVVDFLAEVFDWGDFLDSADVILSEVTSVIRRQRSFASKILARLETGLSRIETLVLDGLGGASIQITPAQSSAAQEAPELPMGPLDYLMALISEQIGSFPQDLLSVLDPIGDALDAAWARVGSLADGLLEEFDQSGIREALADPRKLVDGDPSEWLGLLRMVMRALFNALEFALKLAGDLAIAAIDVVLNLLELRIDLPVVTDFIEGVVLGGRKLTVGLLLALIPAIPTTILYKTVTGSDQGPFGTQTGPSSFAASGGERALRSVQWFQILFVGLVDTSSVMNSKTRDNKGLKATGMVLDLVLSGIFSSPFLDFELLDKDLEDWALTDWLNVAGWGTVFGGVLSTQVELWSSTDSPIAGKVGCAFGTLGGICSVAVGVISCWDEGLDAGDYTLLVSDIVRDLGTTVGGVASQLEDNYYAAITTGVAYGIGLVGHTVGTITAFVAD